MTIWISWPEISENFTEWGNRISDLLYEVMSCEVESAFWCWWQWWTSLKHTEIYWHCGGLPTHEVLDAWKSWKILKEVLHLLGQGQTLRWRVSLQHSSKIYWCMSIMKNTIAFFGTIFPLKSLTVSMLSPVFSYLASECSGCLQPYSVAHSSSKEWYVATKESLHWCHNNGRPWRCNNRSWMSLRDWRLIWYATILATL